MAFVAGLGLVGCSQPQVQSVTGSKELIPAEWTVAEDTSLGGDVTTASLQLPTAKGISGLVPEEESRLVLRCIDHKVEAFIDPGEAESSADVDTSATLRLARIELDSAPACE